MTLFMVQLSHESDAVPANNLYMCRRGYFSRNNMYNRKHTHYWVLENPKVFADFRHQVQFVINVWCATNNTIIIIYNNKLICPIFYDGILTSARYLQLLQNVMPIFLENVPVFYLRNVLFQHDGAPSCKTSPVKQYLITEFGFGWVGLTSG